jgi:16S rRNA processing protein RimM
MKPRAAAEAPTAWPGDEAPWPADAVEVGRISGGWGIKGAIRVVPFSSAPEALFSSKRWFVAPPVDAGPGRARATSRLLRVVQAREQGAAVVATIDDLVDRDVAQALTGWRVAVSRASFPTPDDEEFYWVDLIGCEVVNRQADALGQVESLLETGPHCVLRLSSLDAEGQPRLVPFVSAYVDSVDIAARRIIVDWPLDY